MTPFLAILLASLFCAATCPLSLAALRRAFPEIPPEYLERQLLL